MKRLLIYLLVASLLAASGLASFIVIHTTLPSWYARWWYPLEYSDLILENSSRNNLDPALVAAVIYRESGFDPSITSAAGAIGLMQIMPATAQWIAGKKGDDIVTDDLHDPALNIAYGSWYLRYLADRYGSLQVALAAYNGGSDNVDGWLSLYRPAREFDYVLDVPWSETRDYITRVQKAEEIYRRAWGEELGIQE